MSLVSEVKAAESRPPRALLGNEELTLSAQRESDLSLYSENESLFGYFLLK